MCVPSAILVVVTGLPVPWSARCRLAATRLLPCLAVHAAAEAWRDPFDGACSSGAHRHTVCAGGSDVCLHPAAHTGEPLEPAAVPPQAAHAAARRAHAAPFPAACKPRCCRLPACVTFHTHGCVAACIWTLQVRNRWTELSADEQQKITQLAYQHMKDGESRLWGVLAAGGYTCSCSDSRVLLLPLCSLYSRAHSLASYVPCACLPVCLRHCPVQLRPHVCARLSLCMRAVGHLGQQAAWPLKSKAALLLAAVTRQQGPETYSALLPQLVSSAAEGPMQVCAAHLPPQCPARRISAGSSSKGVGTDA